MPKCVGMKKINIQAIVVRVVLGIFLGVFLIPISYAGDRVACNDSSMTIANCEDTAYCQWIKEETIDLGRGETETISAHCAITAEECWAINVEFSEEDTRKTECEDVTCHWDEKTKECTPELGYCEQHGVMTCWYVSGCTYTNGNCIPTGEASSQKAVSALTGVCHCKEESVANSEVGIWTGKCGLKKNDFWREDIPGSCVPPLSNKAVELFCNDNSALFSDYGKRQCRVALGHVMEAGGEKCLNKSELLYQQSLKDSDAREQRRIRDIACRGQISAFYPGATFSGGGLKAGAIVAHKHLTKSISHETSLKTLILSWTRFVLELVAILAVIAVVWAGILYITDLGDGSNQEKAKKILMFVAIGILVILGSYAIVNTLMTADFSDRVEIINSLHV